MSLRFDLVDLRLFLCVAEAASITHGAALANMALASASERIRAMEDALGAPLLERQRRGVRLTPAGSALVHHARLVSQQLETFPTGDIRLVVAAPARHLLSRRRAVAFRDILDHDLVGLPVGSALQDYLDQHAARAGRRLKLRVRYCRHKNRQY